MVLTRDFKLTVRERLQRDPSIREALLKEAIDCLLAGDVETGKSLLRDHVNATIGFGELGGLTDKSPKRLMRTLSPILCASRSGNAPLFPTKGVLPSAQLPPPLRRSDLPVTRGRTEPRSPPNRCMPRSPSPTTTPGTDHATARHGICIMSEKALCFRTQECPAMSTAQTIRTGIRKLPRGKPFTSARFLKLGSRGAVDRTLSRLVGEGEIQRLSRGVFVRPRTSRFVGTVLPDVREVVETIARNNGETVQVHGAEAARRLRLSTQVPAAPAFHTNASSRTIRIGNATVTMIHTSNRRLLQYAGETTGLALSALWYLGKDNVTPETVATIESALGPREFEKLRSADMPAWMANALRGHPRETAHG